MSFAARLATSLGAGCAGVALVVVACGGRTTNPDVPEGYVDDAGAFHLPDGRVLFGPGSGCVGFVAPSWADEIDASQAWSPQIDQAPFRCDADSQCKFYPPNYPYGNTSDRDQSCSLYGEAGPFCHLLDKGWPPGCNPGSAGDAYCRALYQQFVSAPRAVAMAHCVDCAHWNDRANDYACIAGVCLTDCPWPGINWSRALCVQRDTSSQCERPCKP